MLFDNFRFQRKLRRFVTSSYGKQLRLWPSLYTLGVRVGRFVPVKSGLAIFSSLHVFRDIVSGQVIELDGFISPVIDWNVTSWRVVPPDSGYSVTVWPSLPSAGEKTQLSSGISQKLQLVKAVEQLPHLTRSYRQIRIKKLPKAI